LIDLSVKPGIHTLTGEDTMRFLSIFKPVKSGPPTPEGIAAMGALIEEMMKSGVLIATDGVQPGGKSMRYRLANGKFTATDGPFAEAKELIGGYAVLKVDSMEELAAVTRRFFSVAGDGECEAFQMFEGGPPAMG
jgi:hypothetical protein